MRTGGTGTKGEEEAHSRFAVARETRASKMTLLFAVPAIIILFALPAFASRVLLQELFYVFTMLSLAQLWNLLAGSAGLSLSDSKPSSAWAPMRCSRSR